MSIRKKLDWEYFELLSKNQSYWVETVSAIQDIKICNYDHLWSNDIYSVGRSSSGKSTLLKLLIRLYKPSSGDIKMDTLNVNAINLRKWRDMCGVVMQDGKMFSKTILNNMVLDDEHINYERLREVCRIAQIEDEILVSSQMELQ